MHRSPILFLLPLVACQQEPTPRGPTATTLAIIQTEPLAEPEPPVAVEGSEPTLAALLEGSVESDAIEHGLGSTGPVEEIPLPRCLELEVRSGENLVLLARWADSSVEAIAELNGLDIIDPLFPGQSLLLPTEDEAADQALLDARDAFAQARLDRYLERRGGLMAVEEHRVRTGETAWEIAKAQRGIPPWVLAAYNPEVDLEHLGIGARLSVPVLADTVAELDEPPPRSSPGLDSAEPWDEAASLEPGELEDGELDGLELPSVSETVRLQPGPSGI
jgi:hypothetical protein